MRMCDCCNVRVDILDAPATMLKGGYSGVFCCKCMNKWNEAYHASAACAAYREAEIKLSMVALMAEKGGYPLADVMEAATSTSQMLNSAMRDLYELAKVTLAQLPTHPGGGCKITESVDPSYISPITGKKV